MDLRLREKVVAITGGASGIGKACALAYLEEGCRMAVCGRDEGKLAAFRDTCHAAGYEHVHTCVADVANADDVERFGAEVANRFGKIDIWYNNAGMGIHKPLMDVSLGEWDQLMAVNLRAAFTGARTAAQRMMHTGGGVIINAASFAAVMPVAGNGAYAVSKWGLSGLTRVLAAELAPYNIRVFSFTPGMIETDLTRERVDRNRTHMASQAAMNRVGTPEDLAPTLVMLSSERADYFTGCTIEISGGKFCVQNPNYAWERMNKLE